MVQQFPAVVAIGKLPVQPVAVSVGSYHSYNLPDRDKVYAVAYITRPDGNCYRITKTDEDWRGISIFFEDQNGKEQYVNVNPKMNIFVILNETVALQ